MGRRRTRLSSRKRRTSLERVMKCPYFRIVTTRSATCQLGPIVKVNSAESPTEELARNSSKVMLKGPRHSLKAGLHRLILVGEAGYEQRCSIISYVQ